MKKYNASANLGDVQGAIGYTYAQTMVTVLKACGNNLTRENVMKQTASIHELKLPMLLPDITLSTSANDFNPIKQMQLQRFDGTTWKLFGELMSASGSRARERDRMTVDAKSHRLNSRCPLCPKPPT
jgi:branched-chain amino acid transport system substrate-binding protein